MTTQIAKQSFTFRDAKGYNWVMRVHVKYDDSSAVNVEAGVTAAEVLAQALQGAGPGALAVTNGAFQGATGLYGVTRPLSYGTAAQYLNAEDKLQLALFDVGGSMHRFGIGAPVVAAFLADQETGKGSQLADVIAAFTASYVGPAFICTPNGLAFASAVGSVLIRRTQRRKTTLVSKSSNLDEPGE